VLHWIKGPGIDSAPPRYSRNGEMVSAGWVTTFSERTVVSENRVTTIPNDMPLDVAALLGCAVTTGLGIVFNNAGLRPGQSIAVFGVGGVGLNVIQGAAMVSGHPIVAIDLHDNKLKQATAFGATHTFNSAKGDAHEYLMELSESNGFDATVDVTGNNGVRQTAYDSTSNTGKTIFAGVPYIDEQITIDSFPLHFGRRMIGSHGGETKPDVDIPRYVQLYKLGKLKLDEQISHRFGLDDINDAVETVRSGEAGRCLISMSDGSR
jgi:S-(hydroxymethyl)glutathione dehydrogenase/alcohol dehydrogenase